MKIRAAGILALVILVAHGGCLANPTAGGPIHVDGGMVDDETHRIRASTPLYFEASTSHHA